MSGLAHVIKSCSSRSLLFPLHNLHTFNIGRVNLIPHLHSHARQVVAQKDCGVNALTTDVEADSSVLVAVLEAHEEDVADVCAVGVFAGEEAGAGAGGVESGYLGGGEGGDGVFTGCAGRGDGGEDGDFLHAVFVVCGGHVNSCGERKNQGEVCRTAAGHDGARVEVCRPAGDGGGSGGGIAARVVLVSAQLAQGRFEGSQRPCWSRHGRCVCSWTTLCVRAMLAVADAGWSPLSVRKKFGRPITTPQACDSVDREQDCRLLLETQLTLNHDGSL